MEEHKKNNRAEKRKEREKKREKERMKNSNEQKLKLHITIKLENRKFFQLYFCLFQF